MRIAVFVPNRVGDAIQSTPALRALRGPGAHPNQVIAIGTSVVERLLEGLASVDAFHVRSTSASRLVRLAGTARLLRSIRPDVALLMTNDRGSAAAAWAARVPERIGAARYGRGPFLTRAPLFARGPEGGASAIDGYLDLVRTAGIAAGDTRTELATSARDEAEADQLFASFRRPHDRPLAVLANASAVGPVKLWPSESMARLARRLVDERGLDVLLLSGPGEEARARETAALSACPRVFTLGAVDPSIGLSKACIRRARLLVSTDSGPRHMGPAFGVPTVSLFGPTDPARTDPKTPLDEALRAPALTAGCSLPGCPRGPHFCMSQLSVDVVWEAALRQLSRDRP